MKVHSRLSSKKSKEKRIARVVFVAGIVLIIGMLVPYALMFVGRVALYPVHAVHTWYQTSTSRLPMYLREQTELMNHITELENKLSVAESTSLTQQRLYEENMWLRQLLGVHNEERIAAAVVARPTELPYDLLQIDRGERDGIKVGAPVYIGIDNVIGTVVFVAPTYAFVEMFTSPGFSATAFISGADVMATLEGYGSGVARVSVPQGIPLSVGNLVHIPSINPGVFGRVEYVENRPSQPEQYGYITLNKPISGISYVAVAREPIATASPDQVEENVRQIIKESLTVDTKNFTVATSTASTTSTRAATTTP
ncbi:MAG: hypothetical protein RLZZ480_353 [Candidatus Parcubacteria bacterium]|jgi:cell shape-determining protein MreC